MHSSPPHACYNFCQFHSPQLEHSNHIWRKPQLRPFQRIRPISRPYITFCNKVIFSVRICWLHAQLQSWRTTPCVLSATAYSIYSQLHSISGGRLLHPQPEDVPAVVTRDPLNICICFYRFESTLHNSSTRIISFGIIHRLWQPINQTTESEDTRTFSKLFMYKRLSILLHVSVFIFIVAIYIQWKRSLMHSSGEEKNSFRPLCNNIPNT
jgi:hypothetical protein